MITLFQDGSSIELRSELGLTIIGDTAHKEWYKLKELERNEGIELSPEEEFEILKNTNGNSNYYVLINPYTQEIREKIQI